MKNPFAWDGESPKFKLGLPDGDKIIHSNNTFIRTFTHQTIGNYVFIAEKETPDGDVTGTVIWDSQIIESEGAERYEKFMSNLGALGCEETEEEYMSDADMANYFRAFGEYPVPDDVRPLTPHEDKTAQFFGYLLDMMTADSFRGTV